MLFHERVRNRRKELMMSQDELAIKTGYKSRSSINKIEMGLHDITQSKVVELAFALKTTPEWLMGWDSESLAEGNKVILSREEEELLTLFNRLDNSDKNKLLGYLSGLLSDDKYKKFASVLGM